MSKSSKTSSKTNYRYAVCFDFPMDVMNAPFTRESLETLFKLYQSWGITRIYWIYTWKHAERLWQGALSGTLTKNYAATIRALGGEFLPTAVRLAHKLGLEFYAVYKPFDLAFNETHPFGTPAARRTGLMDALSGRVFWAADCLVKHQKMLIQRRQDDIPADLAQRRIGAIILRADSSAAPRNLCGRLALFVSKDNNHYRPYRGPMRCVETATVAGREVRLEGLRVKEPYLELRVQGARDAQFTNRLSDLVELRDEQGQTLPFTYGLHSRADRYNALLNYSKQTGRTLRRDLVPNGWMFGWHPRGGMGFLRETRHALDNPKGVIAMAKGKEEFIIGMLSPAYPAVRRLFLKHVRECLDAGVDGVDMRVGNHNRNMEWENYGFEQPVLDECRCRGINPYGGARDQQRRRAVLGGFYTEFIRDAARIIHARGKCMHVHVSHDEVEGTRVPLKFEWETWVREQLADEITLMTDMPGRYNRLARQAGGSRQTPRNFRKYMLSIVRRPRWQRMFRHYLQRSRQLGHAGFILYESSFLVHGRPAGGFKVLYPDVPRILREVQAEHGSK